MSRFVLILATAQAIYFGVTGIWPLVSMRTFEAVTGPKIDKWLVKTVGLLVLAVAIVLGIGAWRRNIGLELGLLAITSAGFLGAIDVVYVAKRVIAKIYLVDAVLEAGLILGWLVCWQQWAR